MSSALSAVASEKNDAKAALIASMRGLWLLKQVPHKLRIDAEKASEEVESLIDAMKQGGISGVSPLPWSQMFGDFANPEDPMARICSNIKCFSSNYLNVVVASALFNTLIRYPKRTAVGLVLNASVFASNSAFEAPADQLCKMEMFPFLRTLTAIKLKYFTACAGQGFLCLLVLLSRRGCAGAFLGSLLVLAHAAFKKQNLPKLEKPKGALKTIEEAEEVAKKGKDAQGEFEKKSQEELTERLRLSDFCVTCNTLMHGPNAPGGCTVRGHGYHFWFCHRCGFAQYGGSCVNGCNWGKFGWTCLNPICEGPSCGCRKGSQYWKEHGSMR